MTLRQLTPQCFEFVTSNTKSLILRLLQHISIVHYNLALQKQQGRDSQDRVT